MTFLDKIRETLARYQMLVPGDHLGVAVSGGADSICLFHVLLALRAELSLQLSIIHLDHSLRGAESQADAEFVHNIAQRFSLPFHFRKLELDPARGNLEQEARRARHHFFAELIAAGLFHKVALGHTRSDQAETVLFRLLRGAGSAGLAGIRPVTDSGIVRPLLQVTRFQVEGWLQEREIAWRTDSTNVELRFDRNRIRHQLLPQLQSEWNPQLVHNLAQLADWAFAEEDYWHAEIAGLTANWVRFAESAAIVDVSRLTALPVAVSRRVVREVIKQVKGDLLGVGFEHVEAVRHLAAFPDGSGRLELPGVEIVRSFDWLRFAKPPARPQQDWQVELKPPGRYVVPCRTIEDFLSAVPVTSLELELLCNNGVYNRDVNALDWDQAGGIESAQFVLRNWRPGDQYQRLGHTGPEKLKKLFQQFRVPLWERRNWPIITVGDSIVWASLFGPAAQFAVNDDSRTVLRIHLKLGSMGSESRDNA